MKVVICVAFIIILLLFPQSVRGMETDEIMDELSDSLIDETKIKIDKEVEENLKDISLTNYSKNLENLTVDNIFEEIYKLFKSGFSHQFTAALSLISVLIISSLLVNFNKQNKTVDLVVVLSVLIFTVIPASKVVSSLCGALKSATVLFNSSVPTFAGLVVAKGKAVTATYMSATLLLTGQFLTYVSTFLVVPLSSMQMSLNIGTSLLNDVKLNSVSSSITKISMWILSAVSTVFLGVLGLQSLITVPADNLSMKGLKFVAGSVVPVVGNVISESIGTVSSCVKLLSSTVAIYVIAAMCVILLPVIVDIILWKISLFLCRVTAEFLNNGRSAELIKSAENCFTLILGVTILSFLLFIISVTVITLV